MSWQTVAEGTWDDIKTYVENRELQKGERMRVIMTLNMPVGHAFDLAGMEHVFSPMMPIGMDLVDVWGEGSRTAVVEMEADPAWLIPAVAFVAANWKVIAISVGVVLVTLLALVITFKIAIFTVATPGSTLVTAILIGAAAVGGLYLLTRGKSYAPTR